MDPLAVTIEIFVLTITAAIFGGTALLIALDAKTDRRVLKNLNVVKSPLVGATVHQIQPRAVQQAKPSRTNNIPKAA